MLKFEHVSLRLENKDILKSVSFSVQPGEMVAVIGASGAGKTSLFRLLTGEKKPTTGNIVLDDFSLRELSLSELQKYRRQIGVVFQDFKLLPQKNVYENVAFALEVCGEDSKIKTKVPELLKLVGLYDKRKQFPYSLSGGEKQRLAMARALVHDPKIIIADEPTGNLDPKNSREVAELIQKLHEEKDITIFLSMHDHLLIQMLGPRVIRLEEGKVVFDKQKYSLQEAFKGIL